MNEKIINQISYFLPMSIAKDIPQQRINTQGNTQQIRPITTVNMITQALARSPNSEQSPKAL